MNYNCATIQLPVFHVTVDLFQTTFPATELNEGRLIRVKGINTNKSYETHSPLQQKQKTQSVNFIFNFIYHIFIITDSFMSVCTSVPCYWFYYLHFVNIELLSNGCYVLPCVTLVTAFDACFSIYFCLFPP